MRWRKPKPDRSTIRIAMSSSGQPITMDLYPNNELEAFMAHAMYAEALVDEKLLYFDFYDAQGAFYARLPKSCLRIHEPLRDSTP